MRNARYSLNENLHCEARRKTLDTHFPTMVPVLALVVLFALGNATWELHGEPPLPRASYQSVIGQHNGSVFLIGLLNKRQAFQMYSVFCFNKKVDMTARARLLNITSLQTRSMM